jgi:hypothetical protein
MGQAEPENHLRALPQGVLAGISLLSMQQAQALKRLIIRNPNLL